MGRQQSIGMLLLYPYALFRAALFLCNRADLLWPRASRAVLAGSGQSTEIGIAFADSSFAGERSCNNSGSGEGNRKAGTIAAANGCSAEFRYD